jgi:hypothetical protein
MLVCFFADFGERSLRVEGLFDKITFYIESNSVGMR